MKLLRCKNYDNSLCIREFPYKGKSVWILRDRQAHIFLDDYRDKEFEEIFLKEDEELKVIRFDLIDNYVTGKNYYIPKLENFNNDEKDINPHFVNCISHILSEDYQNEWITEYQGLIIKKSI